MPKPKLRNKKAYVFSLDILIASFIVGVVLLASAFYVSRIDAESFSQVQMIRITYDIIDTLDREGILDSFDYGAINEALDDMRPVTYDMFLKVYRQGTEDPVVVVETADEFPNDQFIISGKWFFTTDEGINGMVDYQVWVKN
ncbi:MAG: hypothetical protein V1740_00775 [Candidatus Woesearchaeota archaeon]